MHVTPETRACASSSQPFVRTVLRAQSVSQEASAGVFASKPLINSSLVKNTYGGLSSCGAHLGHPNFGNQQRSDGCLQRKSESLCGSEARGHPVSVVQPSLENHNRNGGAHKGPRIANVVHRFKSLVEPLEIGIVLSGRLWSSIQAIFPKGLSFPDNWHASMHLPALF
jgi:histone demethylase JARID1